VHAGLRFGHYPAKVVSILDSLESVYVTDNGVSIRVDVDYLAKIPVQIDRFILYVQNAVSDVHEASLPALKELTQVSPSEYCLEGEPHSWITTGQECDCGYSMCRLECTECDAADYACEDY